MTAWDHGCHPRCREWRFPRRDFFCYRPQVEWGKQAEIAQQYLKKGSLIFIEGRIQSREWQDKEGQKRTSFEIVATNFRMLGGRSDAAAASAGGGRSSDDVEPHPAP